MNIKRRRWFKRVLLSFLRTHDTDRMKAGRVIVDKIWEKYLKGRLLGRPTWGAEPRWCRGFTYRKKFSV